MEIDSLTVSIIVPCYNKAIYLDECLQSVLDQNYTNWECIIVNDGSPDHTKEVTEVWAKKDPRFKYLEKENGGPSSARNYGIERATGEFILPLDADDKISIDYVRLGLEAFMGNQNVGIVYCNAEYFGEKLGRPSTPDYDPKLMLIKNLIFCTGLYRKKDWQQVSGYDKKMDGLEDWDFWISLIYNTNQKVIKLDHVGFFYRRTENNSFYNQYINGQNIKANQIQELIYRKHISIYIKNFGNPLTIIRENWRLKSEMEELKRTLLNRILSKIQKIVKPK